MSSDAIETFGTPPSKIGNRQTDIQDRDSLGSCCNKHFQSFSQMSYLEISIYFSELPMMMLRVKEFKRRNKVSSVILTKTENR